MKTISIHFRITEPIKKRIEAAAVYEKKKFAAYVTEWISMLPELDDYGFLDALKFLAEKNETTRLNVLQRAVLKVAKEQGFTIE